MAPPMTRPFQRLAIVNRGEPAVRLIHAARELSRSGGAPLVTIALYTEPDRRALFVREADEAVNLGEATFAGPGGERRSRYLDFDGLERALVRCRAEAAWVGWGFVAERPEFVELCERLGIVFVGPGAGVMRALGDKIAAKRLAERAGVPVAPWSGGAVEDAGEALAAAERLGWPLLIKATAGGGGRGIRRVEGAGELPAALVRARAEAAAAFGDGTVFLEALVPRARHVEVQVVADAAGAVWALGVRDCTLQRRNQKVLEETPSPALSAAEQRELCDAAVRLARAAGYVNAGTVEFLFEPESRRFFFMEVNTRLQVEHPVTEATFGVDLVKLQLHVAAGGRLPAEPPVPRGWAIEMRLNAEDPDEGFAPAPGTLELLRLPTGPGVRTDAGFEEGDAIPSEFDSMIAKVIAWGADRAEAMARLSRALAGTSVVIRGGTSNKGFLEEMLRRPELVSGEIDIGWLDRLVAAGGHRTRRLAEVALLAAAVEAYEAEAALERARFLGTAARGRPDLADRVGRRFELRHRGETYPLSVYRLDRRAWRVALETAGDGDGAAEDGAAAPRGLELEMEIERQTGHRRRLTCGGCSHRVLAVVQGPDHLIEVDGVPHRISRDAGGEVRAPAPAVVVSLAVAEGDEVAVGDRLAVLEAMKMETPVTAAFAGRVRRILVRENVQVAAGEPLMLLEPAAARGAGPGERLAFELLAPPAGGGDETGDAERRSRALRELERLALGWDVGDDAFERSLRELAAGGFGAPDLRRGEDRLIAIYTDLAALFRRVPEGEEEARRTAAEYLAAYLRDLDSEGDGLPAEFLDALRRALAHHGVTRLRRTRRLEDALIRLHKAHRRLPAQARAVHALLERRLPGTGGAAAAAGRGPQDGFRQLLGRLIDQSRAGDPGLRDLAREVHYQLYDRPLLDAARERALAAARGHLDALEGRLRAADRALRIAALADNSQPVEGLLAERFRGPGGEPRRAVRKALLEVLLRRTYRGHDLGKLAVKRIGGRGAGAVGVASARYHYLGPTSERDIQVVAAQGSYDRRAGAAAALAERAAKLAGARRPGVVADLFLWRPSGAAPLDLDATAAELTATIAGAGFPQLLHRAVVTVSDLPPAPGSGGAAPARATAFTFRPREGGGLAEETLYRGLHPETSSRLQLWRLSRFELRRAPSSEEVHLFHGVARDNPRDERLFAVAEVHDLTPVVEDGPAGKSVIELPELERALLGGAGRNPPLPVTAAGGPAPALEPRPPLRLPADAPRPGRARRAGAPPGAARRGARPREGRGPQPDQRLARRPAARPRARDREPDRPRPDPALPAPRRPAAQAARRVRPAGGRPAPARPRLPLRADPPADRDPPRRRRRLPAAGRVRRARPRRRGAPRAGRPPVGAQHREPRGRGDPQLHPRASGGDGAGDRARRPHPRHGLARRARVRAGDRRARPRRAPRGAARVVRALGRRPHRDRQRHREHGLDRPRAAPHRRAHPGRGRDQRRGRRGQRRRPALLERRGDDADAHRGR